MNSLQRQKAERLLALHRDGGMLVLPNVWNPIGARVLEGKGYPAVATASAAISASLGYRDGEKLFRSTMIDVVGRIARSVEVPVTADIEAGYAHTLEDLRATTEEVVGCGVVGVNLEDSEGEAHTLRPVDEQCARIAAMRETAGRLSLPLVINARVDSFLSSGFDREQALEEAAVRAKAYVAAGADCIYPIGPAEEAIVRRLRERITTPINILATPVAAPLAVLREIGVNRVSFGPFIFRACLSRFVEIADAIASGDGSSFQQGTLSASDIGGYLREGAEESSA